MSFKVGVTRDLITASGEPCFNPAAFDELAANPDITGECLETFDKITPDHATSFEDNPLLEMDFGPRQSSLY